LDEGIPVEPDTDAKIKGRKISVINDGRMAAKRRKETQKEWYATFADHYFILSRNSMAAWRY